jgi:DHA1 family inner membrane transport protein
LLGLTHSVELPAHATPKIRATSPKLWPPSADLGAARILGAARGGAELRLGPSVPCMAMTSRTQPAASAASGTGDRMPILVLSVMAAAVFAAITTEVLPVGLLPVISQDLHTSESRVGVLVSAYALVVAVGSIPLTALAVHWPRRAVLCVLLITYAASNAIMASTDDYWVALAARLLGGLAHAGFFASVFAAAVSIVPRAKAGRAVAFVGAGNALGFALGVPLGTAIGVAVGWRWAFAGCAVLMLVLAVLTAIVLPAEQPAPAASAPVSILAAVRGRAILAVAIMIVVLTLGHYTPYTYISPLLLHAGVPSGAISLVLFGFGAAGFLGLLLASAIVDRQPRIGLQMMIALMTACLVCLGVITATGVTIAVVVLWGLAFGSFPTLIQAVALRAVPQARDAAPAVVNSTFNVGIAGGAFLGGRELLVASPQLLALTGAALAATALLLLALPAPSVTADPLTAESLNG